MISIHDFKTSKLKRYYGAGKRVYRQHHVDELIRMWSDLNYLTECSTRTKLVPCNEEFRQKKAIPIYNRVLKTMQDRYPNIKEFHNFKVIEE